MRSQFVLRNQAAMEQHAPGASAPGNMMYGNPYGYGAYGGGGTWVVNPASFSGYYAFDPMFASVDRLASIGLTCDAWRAMTPDQRSSRIYSMLFNTSSSTASAEQQSVASQFIRLIDGYCQSQGTYDFAAFRPWVSVQVIPTQVGYHHHSAKAPGAIGETDRQRMLASMTPEEMHTYSGFDPSEQSTYGDRWLVAHPAPPPGTPPNATAYRFAEDTLGLANGTVASIIASNDRAQSEQLRAQTDRALATMTAQREAAREPLERARIDLQMETLRQSTQQAIAISAQQGVNTQVIVVGAVVAVALVAGAYVIASQVRKNPVVSRSGSRVFIPMRLLPEKEQRRERRNPSEGETVYRVNDMDNYDSHGEYTSLRSAMEFMTPKHKDDRHVLKITNHGGGRHTWESVAGPDKGAKGTYWR